MNFEKLQGGLRMKIGGVLVGINPKTKFNADFYIFTQPNSEFKEGKILSLPGEYEISEIFAFGFGNDYLNWLILNSNDPKEKILFLEKKYPLPEELEFFFDENLIVFLVRPQTNLVDFLKELDIAKIILPNTSQVEFFKNELTCEVETL